MTQAFRALQNSLIGGLLLLHGFEFTLDPEIDRDVFFSAFPAYDLRQNIQAVAECVQRYLFVLDFKAVAGLYFVAESCEVARIWCSSYQCLENNVLSLVVNSIAPAVRALLRAELLKLIELPYDRRSH
ncbi:MAG: hypothetical protein RIG93_10080 [Roseibium album]|uniref:hypothetical protein n=1 Tax=Roseibium album TaxID=311410 RepID=UPI0032EFC5F2